VLCIGSVSAINSDVLVHLCSIRVSASLRTCVGVLAAQFLLLSSALISWDSGVLSSVVPCIVVQLILEVVLVSEASSVTSIVLRSWKAILLRRSARWLLSRLAPSGLTLCILYMDIPAVVPAVTPRSLLPTLHTSVIARSIDRHLLVHVNWRSTRCIARLVAWTVTRAVALIVTRHVAVRIMLLAAISSASRVCSPVSSIMASLSLAILIIETHLLLCTELDCPSSIVHISSWSITVES
jgi:hypothetical protein